MVSLITGRLGMQPDPAFPVLVFFAYAFFGYIMECIVLTIEKRHLVINRGFVRRLPFCIIYGFGAMLGYALLHPLANNLVLLFIVGALAATAFEYCTAMLQIKIFGDFWWDYSQKPLNYKGILCLESTLGWGVVAVSVISVLHKMLVQLVARVPSRIAAVLAVGLLFAYATDFALSARQAARQKRRREEEYQDTVSENILL